jgi:hypothetical protein
VLDRCYVSFLEVREKSCRSASDPIAVITSCDLLGIHGCALRRITVRIEDEEVTTGVERRLPWWSEYLQRHQDGTPATIEDMKAVSLAAHLSVGDYAKAFRTSIAEASDPQYLMFIATRRA